jgi:aspartate kinase
MAELMGPLGPDRPQVFKFGGACFLNLNDYQTVARYIAGRLPDSGRIVAVVSAMSGVSGNLQKAQQGLDSHSQSHSPVPETLTAGLMATADRVSAILLATALSDLGVKAGTLEPAQGGMSAAGAANRAHLTRLDPAPLWVALTENDVVVLAGGEAVDDRSHVVTLGRNSSDLSAVAAAVTLNAPCCEIFSDVPGVFTADPFLLPEAQLISELSYAAAMRMSRAGAKVLHPGALEMASQQELPIICRTRPPGAERGTLIAGTDAPAMVIADTRTAVWSFRDDVELDRVRRRLADEQFDEQDTRSVVVDYEGVRHLVFPGGDPYGIAERCCSFIPQVTGLRLITTVLGDQEPERVLVTEEELLPEAHRRHHLHYPEAKSKPRGEKHRSSMSQILLESAPDGTPDEASERSAS